jgi:hypothetical protein
VEFVVTECPVFAGRDRSDVGTDIARLIYHTRIMEHIL